MPGYAFNEVVSSEEQLRQVIGVPGEMAIDKQIAVLDHHCRQFISRSPLLLVGSSGAAGNCDVSPRGDGPGFVRVLDDTTLAIPERPGNRRADTLTNVIENPHVGLLFLIPNVDETLRINGRARIVRDADLLSTLSFKGKVPLLALAVEVEEVFFHCAKAFRRAAFWTPELWPDRSELPSLGQVLLDQTKVKDTTAESLDASLEEAYQKTMY